MGMSLIVNLTLAALGERPDVSLVVERIPAYLQTLLLTAIIFGGQEGPGWRGFALTWCHSKLAEHDAYVAEHLEDMTDVKGWTLPARS